MTTRREAIFWRQVRDAATILGDSPTEPRQISKAHREMFYALRELALASGDQNFKHAVRYFHDYTMTLIGAPISRKEGN